MRLLQYMHRLKLIHMCETIFADHTKDMLLLAVAAKVPNDFTLPHGISAVKF